MVESRNGPRMVRSLRGSMEKVVWRLENGPLGDLGWTTGGPGEPANATLLGMERRPQATVYVLIPPCAGPYFRLSGRDNSPPYRIRHRLPVVSLRARPRSAAPESPRRSPGRGDHKCGTVAGLPAPDNSRSFRLPGPRDLWNVGGGRGGKRVRTWFSTPLAGGR